MALVYVCMLSCMYASMNIYIYGGYVCMVMHVFMYVSMHGTCINMCKLFEFETSSSDLQ